MIKNPEIGIDFGSERIVIGATKGKNIDTLINEGSFRNTPNLVSFTKNERYLGDEAKNKLKQNFRNTINFFTRFLNMNENNKEFEIEKDFLYVKTKSDNDGKLMFIVNNKNKEEYFYPVQILGIMFTKVKKILSFNDILTQNITVSVPDYLTIHERKLFENAANIGGFKSINLINNSYAVGLGYGFYKKRDFNDKEREVLFIDFGHSKTSIYLIKFDKTEGEIIYSLIDRNCGVRDIDKLILRECINEFSKKTGIDITQNKKAQIRILEVIKKQRIILSGIEEVNIIVECLDEDEDLNLLLTRELFAEITQNIFDKIKKLFTDFKENIKENIKNIHSIELIGGGSRIPLFQNIVNQFFEGIILNRTVDANECIAIGATLKAAIDSPLKKWNNYIIKNKFLSQIKILPNLNGENKNSINLFKFNSTYPKTLSYSTDPLKDVKIKVLTDVDYKKESDSIELMEIELKKVKTEGENPMIKTNFKLNENGYIIVDKIILTEKIKKLVEVKKKEEKKKDEKSEEDKKMKEEKPEEGNEMKEEKSEEDKKMKEEKPEEDNKMKEEKSEEGNKMKEEKIEEPKKEYKMIERNTDITNKAKIYVKYGLIKDLLNKYTDYESKLNYEDIKVLDYYKIKNDFESYIYDTRIKLNENFVGLFDSNKNQEYSNILTNNETWLYGEGQNASYEEFVKKFDELKNHFNYIFERLKKIFDCKNVINKLEQDTKILNNKILEAKLINDESNYVNENLIQLENLGKQITKFLQTYNHLNVDSFNLNQMKANLTKCFENIESHIKTILNERKRKIEEEKKKKEEEEKKRKEEEEEKKKKEEEEKKKNDKKDEKEEVNDKKEEKKDEKMNEEK